MKFSTSLWGMVALLALFSTSKAELPTEAQSRASQSHIKLDGEIVEVLRFDPVVTGLVYAGSGKWTWEGRGGLFRSADGGLTWEIFDNGLTSRNVRAIDIAPDHSGILYVGTSFDGLFRSTDSGRHWQQSSDGLTPSNRRSSEEIEKIAVYDIEIDPLEPSSLFVATRGGVFRRDDMGKAWRCQSEGLPDDEAKLLAIDPKTPSTLYACITRNGIFRTDDGGTTWEKASNGFPENSCSGLIIDPENPTTLYAGSYDRVFKTEDKADTWIQTRTGEIGEISALVLDFGRSRTLYVAAEKGLFKSPTEARFWTRINSIRIQAMAADPFTSDLLASTEDERLVRSRDGGQTWFSAASPN